MNAQSEPSLLPFSNLLAAPSLLLNRNVVRGYELDNDTSLLPPEFRNWVSLNLCTAGRCECWNDSGRSAIVVPGTINIGLFAFAPDRYYYPLGYYEGLQLAFSTDLLEEPELSLLRQTGFSTARWQRILETHQALFYHDPHLEKLMRRLGTLGPEDVAVCKIHLMEILLYLDRALLPQAEKKVYYTSSQYHLAQLVHDQLIKEPFREHDFQAIAKEHGISLSSLNRYFEAVYGHTASTWLRKYRMHAAADLLRETELPASDIALSVGYANPSKFSAAFKREFEVTPSEFRRMKDTK